VKRIVAALEESKVKILREGVTRVNANQDGTSQVEVISQSGAAFYDEVVMACHSDQALDLVHGIQQQAKDILSAIPYQKNRALLHTDIRFLPEAKRCWAAWNYTAKSGMAISSKQHVSVNYLINRLQPLPAKLNNTQIIVSLNPATEPDPKLIHQEIHYSHPVFDMSAIQAQKELPLIQGMASIWYCGAWTGFGFHEDGLRSGELVAEALIEGAHLPLKTQPKQDAQ
jgi:predicted NAD/FAD-binding protein